MKNLNKIFIVLLLGIFVSCDEKLDINTDPNYPGEINAGLALTSAEATLVSVTGAELTNYGGFLAQYHTQAPSASQYENIDSYNVNITYANALWTQLYAGTLTDLQYVTTQSEAAGDTGSALIAEALRAYTFQLLVDLFGDVPYSEALQGNSGNITPVADSGADIYADLIEKLDAAVAAYEANPTEAEVGAQDIIYSADIDSWIQFINTLKLKMYLRMAYTSQANATAVNALLTEGNFITADAKFDNFVSSTNKTNPFYGSYLSNAGDGLGDVNHVASNSLHDFYTENGDPRLQAVFRASLTGTYASIPQGTGNTYNNTATAYARPNIGDTTPVFLISLAESDFLQAEALIRYSGGTGAKEKYDAGVAASFATYQTYFGLDGTASATDFTGAGGAYEYVASSDVETAVRQVIIQKWAALPYVNTIEAFIESTRTKFPEVVEAGTQDYSIGNRIPSDISVLTGVNVPSILYYPADEVNRNPNITQHTALTQNVWWDQKPE
ncbi:SusD/RagB family nutrient-binding outer membrane lipoprotein [Flavobacterium sp. RHBU_3]|uniref:SusD/RagB family nutrient-binding outer membrane lipoprotein n=1 Tax=Flavobacterium sp. RHBU_3 TaxID=3391184 RepID=UPI00398495CF